MPERKSHTKAKLKRIKLLEPDLKTDIIKLHVSCLGYQPSSVTCKFLDTGDLYLLMEGIHSPPEIFLASSGYHQTARQVRCKVNQILKKKLEALLLKHLHKSPNSISLLKPERSAELSLLAYLPIESL